MSTLPEITQASIAASTAASVTKTTATTDTNTSTSKSTDIMGKQDFLKLLVTQLQNQDPLNPDDPTEFTAQLAQFSSLEQLYNLNKSMDTMVASGSNSDKVSALSMIGKEVTYTGSSFKYSGESVQLGYTLDGPASEVQLIIQDSSGKTLQTLNGKELTKGNHFLTWNGLDSEGNQMASGDYKVVIQAKGVDSQGVSASPLIRSEVTGVDMSTAGTTLLNTKAGDIDFTKIVGVYQTGTSVSSNQSQSSSSDTSTSSSDTSTSTSDTSTSLKDAATSAAASAAANAAANGVNSVL